MAVTLEVLKALPSKNERILDAIAAAAKADGDTVKFTSSYEGNSDWLTLWGVGAEVNNLARNSQVSRGKRALVWDLGYVCRDVHYRCSIDTDHPPQWLEKTQVGPDRWDSFDVELRDDFNKDGHILLVGLGRKSRRYLNEYTWEERQLPMLQKRFPGRKIIFRPKKGDRTRLNCKMDLDSPIQSILKGASLVVCRHSNVAIDGVIQNIPFEAEDGAAKWLKDLADRKEFLDRLAWWQWKPEEAAQAWKFLKQVSN